MLGNQQFKKFENNNSTKQNSVHSQSHEKRNMLCSNKYALVSQRVRPKKC